MRTQRFDQLRYEARAVPILQIAERLGLGEPERRGGEWAVLCPLHDDHDPSCYLNEQKNAWYCFVCAVGGDGIELVRLARDVSFTDAVRWLATGG